MGKSAGEALGRSPGRTPAKSDTLRRQGYGQQTTRRARLGPRAPGRSHQGVAQRAQGVLTATQELLSQPPQAVREFVDDFVRRLEGEVRRLASGDTRPTAIAMELKFTVDPSAVDNLKRATKALRRGGRL